MDAMFLPVLNMSLTASYVILFVLAARLLLKKAPKIFSYALWSVVLFRLICPVFFESIWSLVPINSTPISTNVIYSETPQINTGITAVDNAINPVLPVPTLDASVNPLQIWITIGEIVWLIGIAALTIYSVVSLLRLRQKLVGAVKLRDNIYLADRIASPFVIGLIRPKIYLPSALLEQEQSYIILHEQVHIRRFDHITKILAFAALAVHWFNPLVWAAFILSGKDMEMSCDESVMKSIDTDIRGDYSASLLSLATGRKIIAGTPLAFGEGDTKGRIKNVMNYKKPAFWVVIIACIAVIAVCVGLVANPLTSRLSMQWAKNLRADDIEKIELAVLPGEEYQLFDNSEFADIISLINASRGRHVENPDTFEGGSITFYITLTDGTRHRVCNSGNTYLIIDGDFYDAGYNWLSSWEYVRGNEPLPEDFAFDTSDEDAFYKPALMVNGTIYWLSSGGNAKELPEASWLFGQIKSVSASTAPPDEDFEAIGLSEDYVGWDFYISTDGNMIFIEQQEDTKEYLVLIAEGAESNANVLLFTMAERLKHFPEQYDTENAEEDGVVSVLHGRIFEGTRSLFDSFIKSTNEGKAAQIIIASYTIEGDPIFRNVVYDGTQYFAVIDYSRDTWGNYGYYNLRYDYLKIITHPETGSNFVVLTNNAELTFEEWDAQIASDDMASMASIDSYELLSYSE